MLPSVERPGSGGGGPGPSLPVVGEDVLVVSVALSGLLGQLPDALLLPLVGLVGPHQPNLEENVSQGRTATVSPVSSSFHQVKAVKMAVTELN